MDLPAGPVGGHPRRFFLSRTPEEGEAELSPGEAGHALRVLRLGPGDEILGLDGRGRAWPLRIASTTGKRLSLVPAGPALVEPAPGEPGAPLPRIEVACPLPRAGRAEAMLDRLVQLGLAVLTPLVSERTAPGARRLAPNRLRRLERVIAEGGMGAVIAARHADLGELRAIKIVLSAACRDRRVVKRFMQEARATVRLKSEHAVQIHDVGSLPSGEPLTAS